MKTTIVSMVILCASSAAMAQGYGIQANSGSLSNSDSTAVAISPNHVVIEQPNNAVTSILSSSAYAPDVLNHPTAPCRVAIGGSGGWIAGSFGIGGSFEDKECTRREAYRMGISSADADIRAAAKSVYFNLEAVKATGVKMTKAESPVGPPVVVQGGNAPLAVMDPMEARKQSCLSNGGYWEPNTYAGGFLCDARHL